LTDDEPEPIIAATDRALARGSADELEQQLVVERHGDRGELEAFYQSWCLYDWPAADILAGGRAGEHGHYERPHTLSQGDSVCDMCWSAASGGCR
jgi:hypothetical protein